MNKFALFDFQILPAEKFFVSAVSSAAFYGRGVFTTVAVYNGKPFLWENHRRRLRENAERIGIDLGEFDEKSVEDALLQIIRQNNLETGRARLTFFDESASGIWNLNAPNKTSFLITTAEFQTTKDKFSLTVSPFPLNSKSPLANVKSCNYLENTLALEEAKSRGYDEAVRLNEKGEIASASRANIFWAKGENIFTPALETGCLAGTTREFLMENFPVEEVRADLNELNSADEIFLTSAGIGLKNIGKFNGKSFGREIFEKLQKHFLDLTS